MDSSVRSLVNERKQRFGSVSTANPKILPEKKKRDNQQELDGVEARKKEERLKRFRTEAPNADKDMQLNTLNTVSIQQPVPLKKSPQFTNDAASSHSIVPQDVKKWVPKQENEDEIYINALNKKRRAERFGEDPKLTEKEIILLRRRRFEEEEGQRFVLTNNIEGMEQQNPEEALQKAETNITAEKVEKDDNKAQKEGNKQKTHSESETNEYYRVKGERERESKGGGGEGGKGVRSPFLSPFDETPLTEAAKERKKGEAERAQPAASKTAAAAAAAKAKMKK